MTELTDKRIAFLATDGYEDSELTSPWNAVTLAGGDPVMVAPSGDRIEGKNGHLHRVDLSARDARAEDFDALVLPGGVVNADHLRMDEDAVAFARAFFDEGKPVAAICHAAWTLVEADVVAGRTLTSYPSLATDLRNAGATWVDQEVVVDGDLISSRTPDDLPAFNAALVDGVAAKG
ncbi:type 1 glutamine amidotransferase domain-containing protein [Microbacterium sp. SORGH_AS_0888]|uniref:type 1 glutamine amidotransferase domain-containing protein n=1 Tax=Microbacterium sp. SORGH_AS_0888 TaxID=3041791 RepID=UPI0027820FBD|nr:type 1 glutamine amidotransferase domain-containing protein [Microbacterium sp. SORGH_AS_0888]MDQ1128152.1 protease I [Microbacterium sp. SORGH_AS_0888]